MVEREPGLTATCTVPASLVSSAQACSTVHGNARDTPICQPTSFVFPVGLTPPRSPA